MTEHMTYVLLAFMVVTSLAFNIDNYAKKREFMYALCIALSLFVLMYMAVKVATS